MIPWKDASARDLGQVRGVALDIDDTLSTAGKLTAPAFEALWRLQDAGFRVVPITGRPAGWCDHIARFWPVDAVVGENGAFVFYMDSGVRRRLDTPGATAEARAKLEGLRLQIQAGFPEARFASDQAYREFDLAIDVCEDVPAWPRPRVDELLKFCEAQGAHAKLSSIHVNTWFGDYDKRKGFENWLSSRAPGVKNFDVVKDARESWLFIGDSPNDEPMFASFKFSVGVANLAKYQDRLKAPPIWLTARPSGEGFAEMADRLIGARKK